MRLKDEEFSQKNRVYKKNQVDILELESKIFEIKELLDRFNRLNIGEERISEFDYRLVKI